MNRRLHNAMTASVAAGALLLLGLAAAVPAPSSHASLAGAPQSRAAVAAPLATASRGGPRRHRQRLVMPYFSFSRN